MIKFEISSDQKFNFGFRELLEFKELFYFFTWRDIKVKYKQTLLGFLWAILQPLLMMLIFTIFFGRVLSVPSDGIPYPIFVFSGLMFWNIFSQGLSGAGNSMVSNANIIKKIYFPRLIIPISAVLVALFDFLMTFVVFIGLLIFFQFKVDPIAMVGLTLIALLLTVIATLGPGLLLAALNIQYRDFRYIIPFLVQVLLFVTPVIYPTSMVQNPNIKLLLSLNPMAGAINIGRYALGATQLDLTLIAYSIISGLVLLILGFFVFKNTEKYFADIA